MIDMERWEVVAKLLITRTFSLVLDKIDSMLVIIKRKVPSYLVTVPDRHQSITPSAVSPNELQLSSRDSHPLAPNPAPLKAKAKTPTQPSPTPRLRPQSAHSDPYPDSSAPTAHASSP